ncbi:hypothetical protein UFOVP111_33 [uncultured Caudovirales phage]|uniref:Uncharacterized protein n=1 Tax=uncultured Caudovirales phage TaxID=2100421 RepID=A0A6J5L3U4_9CAUD|nr:hypothetical protein UFOVP111_33 [uncultured Caudovirales phage]
MAGRNDAFSEGHGGAGGAPLKEPIRNESGDYVHPDTNEILPKATTSTRVDATGKTITTPVSEWEGLAIPERAAQEDNESTNAPSDSAKALFLARHGSDESGRPWQSVHASSDSEGSAINLTPQQHQENAWAREAANNWDAAKARREGRGRPPVSAATVTITHSTGNDVVQSNRGLVTEGRHFHSILNKFLNDKMAAGFGAHPLSGPILSHVDNLLNGSSARPIPKSRETGREIAVGNPAVSTARRPSSTAPGEVGPSILSISPKQQLGKDTQDYLDKAAPKAKNEMGALELFDHSENTHVESDAKAVRQARAATLKGYGKLLAAYNMLTHPALIDAGVTDAPELDPKHLSQFAGMAKAVHKTQSFKPAGEPTTKIRVGKEVVDVASPDFKYEGEPVVPKVKAALAKGEVTVSKGDETTTQALSEEDRRAANRLIRGEKGRKRQTKKELAEQEARGETRGAPYAPGEGPLGSRDEREEATVLSGGSGTATSLSATRPPTDVAAMQNIENPSASTEGAPLHPIAVAQREARRAALAAAQERASQAAGEAADAAAQTESTRQSQRQARADAAAKLPDVPKKKTAMDRILADAEKKSRRGRRR